MRALLLEDDTVQFEEVRDQLIAHFRGIEIQRFSTESEFRRKFEEIALNPPDVVVIDVMLRWTDAGSEYLPMPLEIRADHGHFRAGIRCATMLATDPRTCEVPTIICSVLERADVPPLPVGVVYVHKESSAENLIRSIRSRCALKGNLSEASTALHSASEVDSKRSRDTVFISYSHKDRRFLDEFLEHLRPYVRSGSVRAWSDEQLQPGTQWFDEILDALRRTRVAVLLVSRAFLASEFIHEHELGPILKEAERGGVTIHWVCVRACSYKESPLRSYQPLLPPEKPIAEMKAERDRAWVKVCEAIKRALSQPA